MDGVVGWQAPSLSSPARPKTKPDLPVDIFSTYSNSEPAPIPANVPDRFVSALWNRGFKDGRFIFGAWGKVQLAFKAFEIPFKAIPLNPGYMQLVSKGNLSGR